jgi:hypothetical protein
MSPFTRSPDNKQFNSMAKLEIDTDTEPERLDKSPKNSSLSQQKLLGIFSHYLEPGGKTVAIIFALALTSIPFATAIHYLEPGGKTVSIIFALALASIPFATAMAIILTVLLE